MVWFFLLVVGSPAVPLVSLHLDTRLLLELSWANFCGTCSGGGRRLKVMVWDLGQGLRGRKPGWGGRACFGSVLLQSLDDVGHPGYASW